MAIVDGMSDNLVTALLSLEQCVEDSYDWSKYQDQGMVGVVYLGKSNAQERYRSFLHNGEIELDSGIYFARDIAPIRECRHNPFALVSGLANDHRKNPAKGNPVVHYLAHPGFVGLFTVEAKLPKIIDVSEDCVSVETVPTPHRFLLFRSAISTIGFMRCCGDDDPIIKLPTRADGCNDCKYCNLDYLVNEIASRS